MNLSKKSFLIIVPVITVFFVVATSIVYQTQKKQILKLEKSRIKLALSELDTLYNQYNSFAESYLYTMTESNSVKYYLRGSDDRYRRIALVRNVENNLKNFKKHRSDFLSLTFARIKPERKVIEYIELSENPFSLIPDQIKSRAFQVISNSDYPTSDLVLNDERSFLAFSSLLDTDTLEPPLATQRLNAISITFALEPTLFLQELRRHEKDFGVEIRISQTPPDISKDINSVFIELDTNRFLITELKEINIYHQLHPTRLKLISICFLFLFLCALILFLLVNKMITGPIRALEEKIKSVKLNENTKLSFNLQENDEIGSLAKEFTELYSKLSKAYNKSNQLLKTDHLTNLTNLYEMNRQFESQIEDAKEKNKTLAFLYLDLDNFKFINDRYGHDIGDKVLVAFSDAIKKMLKKHTPDKENENWCFGRIAGDEFGIILSNSPSSIMVNELCTNIMALFSGGFSFTHGKYPISVSIGVVSYPKDGDTPSQLISNADTAMYQSKRLGKNRVSHYSEQIAYKLRREREVEHELKNANFDKEFYLVFLPIVLTKDLSIYGFESLLRWNSPRLGFVSPAEFIPIAEACGHFEMIDSWVVNQSFAHYDKIKEAIKKDFILSVNLSSAQIAMNKVHEEILNLSNSYNVPRQQIQFEMTETTGAEFSTGMGTLLHTITDAGFKLAIDDFGTGYTSLQQLIEYPASTIKFDKSFLDATMSGQTRMILKPLIELCHSQNISVTVEGIETREHYEYMREIHVDHLQGFLFCQPATIEELPGALITLDKKRPSLIT